MLTRLTGELEQYLYATVASDPIQATLLEAATYTIIDSSYRNRNSVKRDNARERFVEFLEESQSEVPVNDLSMGIVDFRNLERLWRSSYVEDEIDIMVNAELDARAIRNRARIDNLPTSRRKLVKLADPSIISVLQAEDTREEEQSAIAKALKREGKKLPVEVTMNSIKSLISKLKVSRQSRNQG